MFAEATLKGLVDERIWRYDNTTYFRLKVADRSREAGDLFTVALPKTAIPTNFKQHDKVSAGAQVAALRPFGSHFGKHSHRCKN